MVYKFVVLSDEIDDFVREISINSDATFFDLHNTLLNSVKFSKDQMTSFFLCTDNWEKEQEITLVEMDSSSEYDNLTMENTVLEDYIEDEGQKLLYIFDYMTERAFFIELKEIILSKNISTPVCSLSKGNPPQQLMDEADFIASMGTTANLDEDFYGDQDYDLDEIDEEGFSGLDGEAQNLSIEDNNF